MLLLLLVLGSATTVDDDDGVGTAPILVDEVDEIKAPLLVTPNDLLMHSLLLLLLP